MRDTVKAKVRRKLETDGFIENHWAIETRLTTRLGAVIKELRDSGMQIDGAYIPGTKNFRYTCAKKPKLEPKRVLVNGVWSVRFVET